MIWWLQHQWCYITVIPNILCYITNAISNIMYVKFGKLIWIYKLIIWHLLASVHQPTQSWQVQFIDACHQNGKLRKIYFWIKMTHFAWISLQFLKHHKVLTLHVYHICLMYTHNSRTLISDGWLHISVMEIQIWSIISGNWNMNLYELPMIFSNSYPVTSLVEWWNLSIYKGKTIHYLTKQIYYSNFESFIYGLIVRFSINWILKI